MAPSTFSMQLLQLLLLLLLLLTLSMPNAHALYFEDGYDHHYTYSSESDLLGLHNVTTVIKVIFYSLLEPPFSPVEKWNISMDYISKCLKGLATIKRGNSFELNQTSGNLSIF